MERRIRLNDHGFARGVLQILDQGGLAGLQGLGDFRVDAQRDVLSVEVGGHFFGFGLNFVADRGNGFDHAGAGAVRAGLAQDAFQGLLRAFAGDAYQAEFVESQSFGWGAILLQGLIESGQNFFAVAALLHVDEIAYDDAAEVAQADLPDDFLHGFEVGLDDGVFQTRGAFANELAGVDVNGYQRFSVVDDDVAAALEPNL